MKRLRRLGHCLCLLFSLTGTLSAQDYITTFGTAGKLRYDLISNHSNTRPKQA